MKSLRALVCVIILAIQLSPAFAWFPHGYAVLVTNSALSSIVGFDNTMDPFVNKMKMANSFPTQTGTTFVYPSLLNTNQLPNGTLSTALGYNVTLQSSYFGKYVLVVNGTVSTGGNGITLGFSADNLGTVYSTTGSPTLGNCTNSNTPPCSWGGSSTLKTFGTNYTITFDLSALVTNATNNGSNLVRLTVPTTNSISNGSSITVSGVVGSDGNGCGANGTFTAANVASTTVDLTGSTFPAGCTYSSGGQLFPYQSGTTKALAFNFDTATYSNFTGFLLCKLADYNVDNTCNTTAGKTSWPGGFNDDFLVSVGFNGAPPAFIRFLDVNKTVFSIAPDYANWPSSSAFSYSLQHDYWAIPNWFGSDTGTNGYSIACSNGQACTYKLTSSAPVDGDVVQFYNSNASTSANPTLTVTDASSVTSSAIPIIGEGGTPLYVFTGGTITAGDTISLTFNTTPTGAFTCLSGGTHTTSAYTVLNTDTVNSIASQLNTIISADSTLSALPSNITSRYPNSNNQVQVGYANNACSVSITANITGSATETVTFGTMPIGGVAAQTLYSAVYNGLLGKWILQNANPSAGGFGGPIWPWTVQIQLAQALSQKYSIKVGCWLQVPLTWSNASFTSLASYGNANQCPGGTGFELANEIWNPGNFTFAEAEFLSNSVGLGLSFSPYEMLRDRQLWGIAKSVFGSSQNLHTTFMSSLIPTNGTASAINALEGSGLCGTSCSNQAYQNAVGADYNSAPNRPVDYTTEIGQAPYYNGELLNSGQGSYATWSGTCSVASNVLNCSIVSAGTIMPNQGISVCDGVYIKPSTLTDPSSAQLTGTVTTTLNGATSIGGRTWTLTSVSGLQTGMWIYNQTTGAFNGVIASINSGASQITVSGSQNTYKSLGSNDTIVFGGGAGTYALNSTACSSGSTTITGGDILGLQYAADNYNNVCPSNCSSGAPYGSSTDALTWVYLDALNGTRNTDQHASTTIQSNIDSYRAIATVANTFGLPVKDYEAAFQGEFPSTSEAVTIGLPSSAYGGSTGYLANLLSGFKNNIQFYNLETYRHTNELSYLPVGSITMWYVFSSNFPWGLFPSGLDSPSYQSYKAICDYNGGSC